jgi:septum site-determining protein MinD
MSRVYAVASAKGGVGKTTTAANLAAALSAAGARVVAVDADLAMPNLAGALGADVHGATLHDVLAGRADVATATVRGVAGVAVVPGDPDVDAYRESDPDGLGDVLAALSAYDYVLLDTGAGLSHDTLVPLTHADEVLLVSTPDRDALGDTGRTREVAERVGATVAGAALTRTREGTDVDAAATRLGVEVLGSVPESTAVAEGTEAGQPVVVRTPNGSGASAYRALAAALTGETVDDLGSDPAVGTADAASGGDGDSPDRRPTAARAADSTVASPADVAEVIEEAEPDEAADERGTDADGADEGADADGPGAAGADVDERGSTPGSGADADSTAGTGDADAGAEADAEREADSEETGGETGADEEAGADAGDAGGGGRGGDVARTDEGAGGDEDDVDAPDPDAPAEYIQEAVVEAEVDAEARDAVRSASGSEDGEADEADEADEANEADEADEADEANEADEGTDGENGRKGFLSRLFG